MSKIVQEIIAAPSLVREQWLSPELAVREVLAFERRFGSKHLILACHAALPLILTPELLNLIRINFLEEEKIPWVAEVDFLLSPLCRPIDEGLFEVEPSIREVLLVELDNKFGWQRPFGLANFLQFYLAHIPRDQQHLEVIRTQYWIAQAYIDPDRVVEELSKLLEASLSEGNYLFSLPEQIQVATVLELLAEPLERTNQQIEYQYLVNNSRALAQILYGEEQVLKQRIKKHQEEEKVKEEELLLSPIILKQLVYLDETLVAIEDDISTTALVSDTYDNRVNQEELTKQPSLSLAIARLSTAGAENFAIWVLKAPYPGGYVHHDCTWTETLTQTWLAWQEMFSLRGLPHVPLIHHATQSPQILPLNSDISASGQTTSYSSRLMQQLGIDLWAWLFDGPIQQALVESRGIAMGQSKPLRLRLEIRDPDFIPLPWEIMQPMAGKQAVSLSRQLLFSRTTSDVDSLKPFTRLNQALNILLVLGQDAHKPSRPTASLQLEQEAAALANVLTACGQPNGSSENFAAPVPCHVQTLLQPTPAELIEALETGTYNILFYAGHGEPAPDGGLLFLRPDATINGTELAQVLVRTQVTLAVFNACWGAQPDQEGSQTIPRSSLAEVLIHHGVPAVLGMRDSISDREALSFIQTLAQALAVGMPIDQAVAVARQQLLTLYKFNQPAWTLPVLYMHPEFEGELIKPIEIHLEENEKLYAGAYAPIAYLRSLGTTSQVWEIRAGLMRVGHHQENDLVIQEQWVSQQHAEIIWRDEFTTKEARPTYFLRDFSRYGTLILFPDSHNSSVSQEQGGGSGVRSWQRIHHQEVPLYSGSKLKFGSSKGQTFEFIVEASE